MVRLPLPLLTIERPSADAPLIKALASNSSLTARAVVAAVSVEATPVTTSALALNDTAFETGDVARVGTLPVPPGPPNVNVRTAPVFEISVRPAALAIGPPRMAAFAAVMAVAVSAGIVPVAKEAVGTPKKLTGPSAPVLTVSVTVCVS